MPQTAQYNTAKRASAYDDVNSREFEATLGDVVREEEEFRGMVFPLHEDASTTSLWDTQEAAAYPSTSREENDTTPTAVVEFQGSRPLSKPTASLHALQEWEGYVTEIKDTDFTANLLDVTAGEKYAGEVAVIPLEEISEADAARISTGSVFRWVIGYERAPSGNKRRVSQIVFRDLPAFTKRDLQDAEGWAGEMMAGFDK